MKNSKLDLSGLRSDGAGYEEGLIIGDSIDLTLAENSWVFPTQTVTIETLTDAGTVFIPAVTAAEGAQVTDLCEAGVPGTVNGTWLQISIDKKISEVFDGCFTVAGIADKQFENTTNSKKLAMMAQVYNQYIYDAMITKATESAIEEIDLATATKEEVFAYVTNRIAEYKKTNHMAPDYALVSTDFLTALERAMELRETNAGDAVLINGFAGQIKGITFIERYDQVESLVLCSKDDIVIARPASPKQIPGQGILGSYQMPTDVSGFYNGIISFHDVQASKAVVNTWIHKFFGVGIVQSRTFIKPKAGAGTGL